MEQVSCRREGLAVVGVTKIGRDTHVQNQMGGEKKEVLWEDGGDVMTYTVANPTQMKLYTTVSIGD